jgi:hypothetical protein
LKEDNERGSSEPVELEGEVFQLEHFFPRCKVIMTPHVGHVSIPDFSWLMMTLRHKGLSLAKA